MIGDKIHSTSNCSYASSPHVMVGSSFANTWIRRAPRVPNAREFKRLWVDIARRRFDLLLFWSLDRFTREGTFKTLFYLKRYPTRESHSKATRSRISIVSACSVTPLSVLLPLSPSRRGSESLNARRLAWRVSRKQGKRLGRPSFKSTWLMLSDCKEWARVSERSRRKLESVRL